MYYCFLCILSLAVHQTTPMTSPQSVPQLKPFVSTLNFYYKNIGTYFMNSNKKKGRKPINSESYSEFAHFLPDVLV